MENLNEHIKLRPFTINDIEDIYDYGKEEGVFELTGMNHLETLDDALLLAFSLSLNRGAIAVVYDDKVIGSIDVRKCIFKNSNLSKEIGFVLNKDYWGRGIMTYAINQILDYLFTKTKTKEVWAGHFYYNERSMKTIIRCGFEYQKSYELYFKDLDQYIPTKYYVISKDDYQNIRHI